MPAMEAANSAMVMRKGNDDGRGVRPAGTTQYEKGNWKYPVPLGCQLT